MTLASILYACRALATSLISASNSDLAPLRHTISNTFAELAYRRWLEKCGIPYRLIHAAPFSMPHLDEVLINDHRCHLVNYPLHHHEGKNPTENDLAILLSAPACMAKATLNSDHLGSNDLLLFSFTGLQPPRDWHAHHAKTSINARNFFIYIIPKRWSSRSIYAPWRLSNYSQVQVEIEVGGASPERTFVNRTLQLLPYQTVEIDPGFASIAYLSMSQSPPGTIAILRGPGKPQLITPSFWGDLWTEAQIIILAGCMLVKDFRLQSRRLYRPQPPWDELPMPSMGYAIPVNRLHPCTEFISA